MLQARARTEFGSWGIPGRKPLITYDQAVMTRLGMEAAQAGPIPVGGVLFGTTGDQDTRVMAFRPLDCAGEGPSGGPFSEAAEEALLHLTQTFGNEPELSEMQPVGWYRSVWESPIQLSQDDLRIWNRYFPLNSQVSLVLRVQADSPVRAGFFFRPQLGGPVRIDSSYRTFEIAPTAEMLPSAEAVHAAPDGLGQEDSPSMDSHGGLVVLRPPAELYSPPMPARRLPAYFWAALALAVLVVLIWPLALALRKPGLAIPVQEVGLRFTGSPARLLLVWNPKAPILQLAERAELRLIDSSSDTAELIAGREMAEGTRRVANFTGAIEAQFRIDFKDGKQPSQMVVAQYVGPAAGEVLAGVSDTTALQSELAGLQVKLVERAKTNGRLEDRIQNLRHLIARRGPAKGTRPIVPVSPNSPPPPDSAVKQQAPGIAETRPMVQPTGAGAEATVERTPPAFGADRPPLRASLPTAEPPPSAPAYSGPTSGKFIWTGYLAPGKTVTIDGRRASAGSVNGSLPGVPVRVAVYPAEFSSDGLAVFSALTRHQANAVTENRSAQNGWLNTRYVYEPGRARDAQLAAAPSDAGGFKQIQISGGDRPVSVVVVEWSVIR